MLLSTTWRVATPVLIVDSVPGVPKKARCRHLEYGHRSIFRCGDAPIVLPRHSFRAAQICTGPECRADRECFHPAAAAARLGTGIIYLFRHFILKVWGRA